MDNINTFFNLSCADTNYDKINKKYAVKKIATLCNFINRRSGSPLIKLQRAANLLDGVPHVRQLPNLWLCRWPVLVCSHDFIATLLINWHHVAILLTAYNRVNIRDR